MREGEDVIVYVLSVVNIVKDTTDLRVACAFTKITAFRSCHKLVKIQPQNLDQTSASES